MLLRRRFRKDRIFVGRTRPHEFTAEGIRKQVSNAVRDVHALLAKSSQLAKTKLAAHIDSIRLLSQLDGTYLTEGEKVNETCSEAGVL
jgi:hypothetical protein